MRNGLPVVAACSAALAIAAGAFGAHGASEDAAKLLQTGGSYLLVHAVAVIALQAMQLAKVPQFLLLSSALVFAVSLFALALGAPTFFGIITPFGGLGMIVAWLWIAYELARRVQK